MTAVKKYYGILNEGSKIIQFVCAILINFPVFAYGACIGWMSPMTLLLQSKDTPTGEPVSDFHIAWMASISYFLGIPSSICIAWLCDKLGRKFSLLFASASCAVSWILLLCSVNVNVMIFARDNFCIVAGCSFVTCPLYTKEISDDSIRGTLGCLVILFQTSGNLFMYIVGDLLSYRAILWVSLGVPVTHMILFMMIPESPSYLVKHGKMEKARKTLAWLKCRQLDDPIIQMELERIKKEQLMDEEGSKFLLKDIVTNKIRFRAFRIVMLIALGREVCGAITVLNFAGEIFRIASEGESLSLTANQQAMVLGTVQVAGATLASSIVEKAGRKSLLFITSLISGISMCALASWFVSKDMGLFAPTWLPVVSLCICIFCDSLGLQPISVVITSEIFSYKYRGTVLALATAGASLLCFLQLLLFKAIATSVGVFVAFYFFAAVCISTALYVIIVIPETKTKPLEEIYADLRTKKEKKRDREAELRRKEVNEA